MTNVAPEVALPTYWITPVADRRGLSSSRCLHFWLDRNFWGLFSQNRLRTKIRAGDWVAFYGANVGVIAYARVRASPDTLLDPRDWPEPTPVRSDVYRLPLDQVTWLEAPISVPSVLDRLAVFHGRRERALRTWAWLVNSTRRIPEPDFRVLTGH